MPPLDPGLQRERTVLAWNRTALGLVGNGVLVLVRHERALPLPVSIAVGGAAFLIAALAVVHASLRSALIGQGEEEIRSPRVVVSVFAVAVALLCLVTVAAIAADLVVVDNG